MLYTLKLSHDEIQNIFKALCYAEESEVIDYETVAKLYDYIADEVEMQRLELEKLKKKSG